VVIVVIHESGGIPVLAEDRYKKILELLNKTNSVKTSTLIKLFNVSVETVRRDLEYLEGEGLLTRVYGGAVRDKVDARQQVFLAREGEHATEKAEIADTACRFVEEGQSLALDVSTTNLEIAKKLKNKFKNLTILTNSIRIATELADMDDYSILLTGGVLRKEEYSLIGEMCEEGILRYHVDTAFISASGISLNAGITDFGFGEVRAKKKMIEIAQKVIVVCNSSRFDVISLLNVCELERVDTLITDSRIKDQVFERYKKAGVDIVK
jgi:DeoR/GlpR family transcriptional regulator of sugar metabolism